MIIVAYKKGFMDLKQANILYFVFKSLYNQSKYCNIIVTYKKGFMDLKQANILYFVLKPELY